MPFIAMDSIVRRYLLAVWCLLSTCVVCLPVDAEAQLIISEFRLRGPSGTTDEFIEIYNNSGADHTVAAMSGTGYALAASDGITRCTIPNGTIILSRGHYLCINSIGYSLGSYPAGSFTAANGNASYTTNIPDNAGIALFNNNTGGGSYSIANRFDAVGSTAEVNTIYREGTGYPQLAAINSDYSFIRRLAGGCTGSAAPPAGNCAGPLIQINPGPSSAHVQDSGVNADDFIFVDSNGTNAGAGQRLGAPGPENLSSPISRDGFDLVSSRLDSCRSLYAAPNVVRTTNSDPSNHSTFGALDIRRTFRNTTGVAITRLRFRVIDITTFPSVAGVADLRPRTSTDIAVTVDRPPCGSGTSTPTVRGTTLDEPPPQVNGSGFNGSLSVGSITPITPLPAGASVDVRFLVGIQQSGWARFCVAAETFPAMESQTFCFISTTQTTILNSSAITIPASGSPGQGTPYPSNITVTGLSGTITKVTATLRGMNHTFPDDIDVLLVGPTGEKILLMSDAGGNFDLAGLTITFDSTAAASLADTAQLTSGTFLPSNFGTGDTFPAPAPIGPYTATTLAAFNGTAANGTWSLYVVDDVSGDGGNFSGGWELAFTTSLPPPATSDFNGNGTSEPAVYRPSTGTWFAQGQGPVQFGLPGDVIVAGDFSGGGATDRAVYRPSTSTWFVPGLSPVQWGSPGDIPVPGDYDGNGQAERAVYRRVNGTWYVQNEAPVQWGLPGDIPVPGDYNGDLMMDLAVYRPSTGVWFVLGQTDVQHGLPGDIPVPADYTGDGATDRAVYRPSTGTWFVQGMSQVQWGLAGDIPVPADFDGDGETDLAVYRPSNGTWYTKLSTTNYESSTTVQFGLPGDIPIPNSPVAYVVALRSTLATQSRVSDFDSDRASDLTVFRASSATWFTLRSSTDFATSASVQWGVSGDVPVPGDYDGDGQTDNAVYRPSSGQWLFLRSTSGNATSTTVSWGLSGDVPVAGDYDGDGFNDPAVYRPSTGEWFILQSSSGFTVFQQIQWGLSGDVPLTGDFEGDGISDLTVYRPSSGTWFTKLSSTAYASSASQQWGLSGDVAVPGEYDGDGRTDHAVYRPSNGTWYILHSSTNQTTSSNRQWGLSSDLPVPGEFDGDRKTDVAVWRPSNATWYLLLSSTNFTVFDQIQWGLSSDIPILKRP